MDIEKIKVGDVIHDIRDAGALREIEGKGLSTNDYTNEDKSKLEGIEADAQKNKIESIKVNGSDVTPDPNKAVNVSVPTKMSDLNLDGGDMASGASLRFKNAGSSMVIQPFGIVKESNNQSHVISFPDKQGTVALTSDIPDVSSKQDTIQDLSEIRSGAAWGATAYQKPSAGIPSSDMTDTAQQAISFAESTEKRSYNSSNPDGMGYLVLKKNKTFAEQVTEENTIYEIRYDFDLGGESVTIPEGCVLHFNGGYVSGGSIALNGAKIVADTFGCFRSVTLSGVARNPKMDVRIFNIFPDNSSFDTGAYIKTYLLGIDGVEFYFPGGNYYLSELFITKNDFAISGVPRFGNNMTLKTIFRPFNNSQYYIIKIGGKETALSPTNRVAGTKIYDIQFSCSASFVPKALTNEYGNNADYTSALCVLDYLQVGLFAISGSSNYGNIPSVLFGQIYECVFDYLLFYGGQGKSNCPRLQIVCSQSHSISATYIELLMAESITGPIISTSAGAGITEMTIHQVFFEGVMIWAGGVSDVTQYGTEYVDFSQYDCVPMFLFQGFGTIRIDNISITQTNYHWKSTLDDDTDAVHYRGFIKSNLTSAAIVIGTIYNGGGAETLYIDNIKTSPYNYLPKIVIKDLVSCSVQQKAKLGLAVITDKINDIPAVGHKSRYLYLCPQRLFIGKELQELAYRFGTNAKVMEGAAIIQKGLEHYIQVSLSQSSGTDGGPFLNPNGMIVPTDYLYILTTRSATTLNARISYRDADDNELSTKNISFVPLANILNPWFIKLNKPSNCHHIVIYNQTLGYGLNIYGIMATNEAVYARKSGTSAQRPAINSVQPGFVYYDTSFGRLLTSNGSAWVDVYNFPVGYRVSTTADRPNIANVGAGYIYFDTTLGKMIVSNGTAWVNMDGTALS